MAKVDEKRLQKARDAWQKAIERDKPSDAAKALGELAELEPKEPRWPHRLGEALAKLGKNAEAEEAFERAARAYAQQGFLARAVAVAKLLIEINPARGDLLAALDQDPARELRKQVEEKARAREEAHTQGQARVQAQARARAQVQAPVHVEPEATIDRISLVIDVPMLEPATDSAHDEVRFGDAPALQPIVLELDDEIHDDDLDVPVDATRLAAMSAAPLFANVPAEALGEIARRAQRVDLEDGAVLCRRGEPADSLIVLVEGRAWVELPGTQAGGVELGEGEVLGEATLLAGGKRGADVRARGRLVALTIGRAALDALFAAYPSMGEVLFALLVRRLVANTLETSPLFAAFDPATRAELARHFEVRRARAGTVLEQRGKRSDGLYLAMSGALEADGTRIKNGALFGQAALLSNAAAPRTVTVASEAVVLRLPASKFGAFIAEFPPALAHLAEIATEPLAELAQEPVAL